MSSSVLPRLRLAPTQLHGKYLAPADFGFPSYKYIHARIEYVRVRAIFGMHAYNNPGRQKNVVVGLGWGCGSPSTLRYNCHGPVRVDSIRQPLPPARVRLSACGCSNMRDGGGSNSLGVRFLICAFVLFNPGVRAAAAADAEAQMHGRQRGVQPSLRCEKWFMCSARAF